MRIVSLLPSTTEILFALGAGDQVVGVTFECDTPAEARERTIVSTTAIPEGLSASDIDAFGGILDGSATLAVMNTEDAGEAKSWLGEHGFWDPATLTTRPFIHVL